MKFDENGKAIEIVEKPKVAVSPFAIPGLYFFDNSVCMRAKSVRPSARGELEIVDVLNSYLVDGALNVERLSRGSVWLDTGSFEALIAASNYVKVIEDRQGYKIGCIEEVALINQWISKKDLKRNISDRGSSPYVKYLNDFLF